MQQSITTQKLIYDAKKEEPVNLEIVLPEYLPGISKVVKTDTVFGKCDFYTENGKAFADIDAKFDILYLSDFGGKIKCASFEQSYRVTFKEPFETDAEITAFPTVYASGITAKPVTGRKIHLKGTLFVNCSVYSDEENSIYVPDENDAHICTLEKNVTCCDVYTVKSEVMSAVAELNLEKDVPSANEVIMPKVGVHSLECNCEEGKLRIKAALSIYALYECVTDEASAQSSASYAQVSSETEFECSVEDSRINENQLCNPYIDIVSVDCSCSYDSYGESRIITCDIKYVVTAKLFENKEYTLSEDVFSTKEVLEPEFRKLVCTNVLKPFHFTSSVSETVHGDLTGLAEISGCFVSIRAVSKENSSGKAYAHAKCLLEIIGVNSQGELCACALPVTFHIPVDDKDCADNSADYYITVRSCNGVVRDGSVDVDVTFDINGVCKKEMSLTAVCSVEKAENGEISKNNGEITVCYPSKDDTLWSVAKRYFVHPHELRKLNGIDENSESLGNIIIIP